VELDADDAAATAAREEPRGAAQSRAHVEDLRAGLDSGAPREDVDGADAAVVILVEVEQVLGGEPPNRGAAGGARAYVRLVDRMTVVELDRDSPRLEAIREL
jgi:hypothetical protein